MFTLSIKAIDWLYSDIRIYNMFYIEEIRKYANNPEDFSYEKERMDLETYYKNNHTKIDKQLGRKKKW